MTAERLYELDVTEASKLIRARKLSPVELVRACLDRVESMEQHVNAFITIVGDDAIAQARRAEEEIMRDGPSSPLHGIPYALKDVFYTAGIRTTLGTKLFHDFVPEYDSTVATLLREAGAILIGKLNMDQMALGPTGENPDYGDVHNPWNTRYISGGSSSGAAAATAAGECFFAVGSDTGGSVRLPASLCNLVGLKPTFESVSRHGMARAVDSFDHAGPLTRTIADCATVMETLARRDEFVSGSSSGSKTSYRKELGRTIKGAKIGVVREFFELPMDEDVSRVTNSALSMLESLGAITVDVSWPLYRYCHAIYSAIRAEASALYWRFIQQHGHRLEPNIRRRLQTGFFTLAPEYMRAQWSRQPVRDEVLAILKEVDVIVGPTLRIGPVASGTSSVTLGGEEIDVALAYTEYLRPFNVTGHPALTLPCGFTSKGMPIGLQIAGRPFDEESIFRIAYAYEQATEWHLRHPAL